MAKKDNKIEQIKELAENLLAKLSVNADVVIKQEDSHYRIDITSEDAQLLIGFKGQTLSALEHMMRVLSTKEEPADFTLSVDVGGYRAKRMDELGRKTKEIAWTVKQTGIKEVLPPMNAAERRHIHQLLNDIEGVIGESEGFGRDRRLVLKPKK